MSQPDPELEKSSRRTVVPEGSVTGTPAGALSPDFPPPPHAVNSEIPATNAIHFMPRVMSPNPGLGEGRRRGPPPTRDPPTAGSVPDRPPAASRPRTRRPCGRG